ncbi:MAG: hypothetical protein QOK29_1746 [Rhodospirillaceae bacterium]|jgi:hypothetical protein|nr:hypothetical protein [Rhodospirillaceae bacterium]
MKTGYFLFRKGDKWAAVGPHFVDYQKTPAGIGDTKEEAVSKLITDPRFQIWLKDVNGRPPKIDEFREETPWDGESV